MICKNHKKHAYQKELQKYMWTLRYITAINTDTIPTADNPVP